MLEELKTELEKTFPKIMPGLQWQDRAIVELNGTRWINLRFTSIAIDDTDVKNDMYVTPFTGNLVIFNYNAPVDKWETSRQIIEESKSSIRIRS